MVERIAFVTYETPYSPCGGIAAVMKHLPSATAAAARKQTIVISPCHYRVPAMARPLERATSLGSVGVRYDGRTVNVRVLQFLDDWSWYFLLPEDPEFFAGRRHPYDVGETGEEIGANLLRDSLLFGAAVPPVLHMLAPGKDWALLLQDWEAATAALAIAQHPTNWRVRLTLHNSYDADCPDEALERFHLDPAACPGTSVLQRALDVVEQPVTTVSQQFAVDMVEDVQQTDIICPHLQNIFRQRPVKGVDNGPFAEQVVPQKLLDAAAEGQPGPLHEWKTAQRVAFVKALTHVHKLLQTGEPLPWGNKQAPWGDPAKFLAGLTGDEATPWFVMGGRDDSRQKGYDVAVQAVRKFLDAGGDGRFLFFPIPGDEGLPGLKFLQDLAEKEPYSRRVLVFPFRFRDGFLAALQGATYGIMPSLYEPFGGANEFYLSGTPGVARATGGLAQQIIPVRNVASYTSSVDRVSKRWIPKNSQPTGFLFREPDGLPSAARDWQGICAGAYNKTGGDPNRVWERSRFALYMGMGQALTQALQDASALYREDRESYYKMLAAGVAHINATFSWERAAKQYLEGLV